MIPIAVMDMLRQMAMQQQQPVGSTLASQPGAPREGGLAGFLSRPGLRDALISTGAAMMSQADRPGSFAGALGQALPAGMATYRQGQERHALSDALADAPGSMKRLMQINPQAYMALAAQKPASPFRTVGNAVFNEQTGEWLLPPAEAPERELPVDLTADVREAMIEHYGQTDPFSYTDEMWNTVASTAEENARARERASVPRETTGFNRMADRYMTHLSSLDEAVANSDMTMRDLMEYRATQAQLNADAGEEVIPFTGTFAGVQTTAGKIASALGIENDFTRSAALTENLKLLTTRQALSILSAFPGQLSEKELAVALFLAGEITFEEANLNSILDVIEYGNTALVKARSEAEQNMFDAEIAHSEGDPNAIRMLNLNRTDWSAAKQALQEQRAAASGAARATGTATEMFLRDRGES